MCLHRAEVHWFETNSAQHLASTFAAVKQLGTLLASPHQFCTTRKPERAVRTLYGRHGGVYGRDDRRSGALYVRRDGREPCLCVVLRPERLGAPPAVV
jgi:hypothetical protein